jgi:hypothetical protein
MKQYCRLRLYHGAITAEMPSLLLGPSQSLFADCHQRFRFTKFRVCLLGRHGIRRFPRDWESLKGLGIRPADTSGVRHCQYVQPALPLPHMHGVLLVRHSPQCVSVTASFTR